jgi:hypothetical protein
MEFRSCGEAGLEEGVGSIVMAHIMRRLLRKVNTAHIRNCLLELPEKHD